MIFQLINFIQAWFLIVLFFFLFFFDFSWKLDRSHRGAAMTVIHCQYFAGDKFCSLFLCAKLAIVWFFVVWTTDNKLEIDGKLFRIMFASVSFVRIIFVVKLNSTKTFSSFFCSSRKLFFYQFPSLLVIWSIFSFFSPPRNFRCYIKLLESFIMLYQKCCGIFCNFISSFLVSEKKTCFSLAPFSFCWRLKFELRKRTAKVFF